MSIKKKRYCSSVPAVLQPRVREPTSNTPPLAGCSTAGHKVQRPGVESQGHTVKVLSMFYFSKYEASIMAALLTRGDNPAA